jgi:hypothetical protein
LLIRSDRFIYADLPRISLQNFVRLVGRLPNIEEEIEIVQRRSKLSSRITFHQHQARQLLELSAEEEDDLSYGYMDTHIWVEGDDGELTLIPEAVDNPVFQDPELRQKPERFSLSMPSHLGIAVCEQRGLSLAVHAEIQLRIGQCNDALQAVRLFIGKKAFVFKTNI